MKTVLVVNPPNSPYTDSSLLIEPIDVLSLATYLRTVGCRVVVKDMDHEQVPASAIDKVFRYERPDVVVIPFDYHIPLYTGAAIAGVQTLVRAAQARSIPVVVGGRPAKQFPTLFLERPGAVVIRGEMEPALTELLDQDDFSCAALRSIRGIVFRDGSQLVKTADRLERFDIQRLPIPDRSLLPVDEYIDVRSILSSRGCVESCSFCPVHQFWGKWRMRLASQVVDEVEILVREFSASKILLLDDHAMVHPQRMRDMAREIRRRGIEVSLGCLGTPRSADYETLVEMAHGGFRWVHFGAESGSNRVLSTLRKRSSASLIASAVTSALRAGLRVRTSWIVDPPGGQREDLLQTLSLIEKLQPHEVRLHHLAIRADAPLGAHLEAPTDQYIHAGDPHSFLSDMSADAMRQALDPFLRRMTRRGYRVVHNASEWGAMGPDELNDPEARFISFCPGRYGIGWSRARATVSGEQGRALISQSAKRRAA